MATTYPARTRLAKPDTADRDWDVPLNANTDYLDGLAPVGGLNVSTAEEPSASLNVRVGSGKYRKTDGTVGTYAGTSSQAVAASSTKVIYLTNGGTLTVAASYPTTPYIPLATVVTGGSTITSITDDRVVCGTTNSGPRTGTAVLVGGTVVVSDVLTTTSSLILLTCQTPGGTPGFLRVSTRTAATSFTILSSSGSDTSTVGYSITEP